MTHSPRFEAMARKVLSVFADNHLRCGEALLSSNVASYLAQDALGSDEVEAGLVSGERMGWFDRGENDRVVLTQAGFAAI